MNEHIRILVVDDEVNSTRLMKKILSKNGYIVTEENNSTKAKELIQKNNFDIVVSDMQMPGLTGLDLLKSKPEDVLFILVTGFGSIDSAVESMKNGAFDYISKPFNMEEFIFKVGKAAEHYKLNKQINSLRSQVEDNYSFSNIIGKSRKMQNIFELIEKVAKAKVNVLIEGESGTGKELVSRAIHFNSTRKEGPFVAINCSAIPDNLLESELFGHTKGAFTGAIDTQLGVFEQANGGTLLLDEIADMPYNLQSKLLRVIENWEIKPLGSDKVKNIDVRLISATNQNLRDMITKKKFREDLYFRISTVSINLPSLNERKEDIPLLVNYLLGKYSDKFGKNLTIDADGLDILMKNDWKGNIRELENVLERAAISSVSDNLTKKNFKFLQESNNSENPYDLNTKSGDMKQIEKYYIAKVLEENNWNKLKVSQILGIDRKTLYKKIRDYGLE